MNEMVELTGFGPRGADGRKLRLAMQDLHLGGRVTPVGARLLVRHIFQSAETEPLEVVYAFALPRDAALRRFTITGEGFETHSELRPVAAAREAYEAAMTAGSLAALAQTYGDGLVNLTVGNIRPGETVRVYLELLAGVEGRDDGFRFRFPFAPAPCYHAEAHAVRDGDRGVIELPEERFGDLLLPPWQLDRANLHRVNFSFEVEHPAGIAQLASPSHPIAVTLATDGRATAALATAEDRPDRDLVLDLRAAGHAPRVLAGLDAEGHGHGVLVAPSTVFGEVGAGARRVVFLVDRSGSMGGAPMAQARNAVRACLGALSADDQFGVVAFDNRPETLGRGVRAATEDARTEAADFLQRIDARGGTELAAGLRAAAALLGADGGDILLMTDGQVYGGEAIIADARRQGARVHCLGIGSASQDRFLALLARETGGVSRFMTPRERVDLAALELFNAIGRPLAEGVTVTGEGIEVRPAPPARVHAGAPLACFFSSHTAEPAALALRWMSEAGDRQLDLPVAFTAEGDGETLRLLQGARLIADLEASLADGEDARHAKRQQERTLAALEALCLQYGLASRAMALVAVVQRAGDHPGELPVTTVVPVGLPQDVAAESYFRLSAPPMQAFSAMLPCAPPRMMDAMVHEESWDANRISAQRAPLPAEDEDDLLVELAGRLRSDGGMPGRDIAERLLSSALALLLFAGARDELARAFALHIERLTAFLRAQDRSALTAPQRDLLAHLLEIADSGVVPPPLRKAARALLAPAALPSRAWEKVEKALPPA